MNTRSLTVIPAVVSFVLTAAAAAHSAAAQVEAFGGNGERKSSSLYFWDRGAKKLAGGYCITYGSPEWQKKHDAEVTSDKDASLRLGSDDWASLDTFVPLSIGGVDVPAGHWYLGLRRESGAFFLMVLDAAKIRAAKTPAWETESVTAAINAPLEYSKTEHLTKSMTITVKGGAADPTKGSITLEWGRHRLKAAVVAHLARPAAEGRRGAGSRGGR